MTIPTTPSRRSKRFQPLVSPSKAQRVGTTLTTRVSWEGDCIFDRRTDIEIDLFDEEREKAFEDQVRNNYDDARTYFYQGFTRSAAVARKGRGRARGKATAPKEDPFERYRLGDTVLVTTLARLPSIGVISAMWQVQQPNDDDVMSENSDDMYKIRVHWYLRPSELPSIRAKREHFENEVYYSVSSSAIVPPSSIQSHCTITPNAPSQANKLTRWSLPSMSSKRKPTVTYASEDSESETETVVPSQSTFYCHLAVDSRRGLFYEFSWPEHLAFALSAVQNGEPDDENAWSLAPADLDRLNKKGKHQSTSSSKPRGRAPKTRLKDDSDSSLESQPSGEEYQADDASEDEHSVGGSDDDELGEVEEALVDEEGDYDVPTTPSRKRKRNFTTPRKSQKQSQFITPRKARGSTATRLAQPTPHSKAALSKRRKLSRRRKSGVGEAGVVIRDGKDATYALGVEKGELNLPEDPWVRATYLLHVGSRPDALPCREQEYDRVLRSVSELLEEGSGGCIYISGVPGTGKTATVHAVVRELKQQAEQNETNPFTYVEINGLRLSEPAAAYSLLYEAVSGHDVERDGHLQISAKESLKLLTKHFSSGNTRGPGAHACVVLMDELDQLMTTKQDVVYNFFNWPTLVGSKLVVLAVANTMDLPERVMTGRVRSRLGMIRINFEPYKNIQLIEIVQSRLASSQEGLEKPVEVIKPDAIKFAAMKVSGISGDARRVLDICRRTVELVQHRKRAARMDDVKEVIKAMQHSPVASYLRDCSLHERIMLASLVKCIKREGVEEIKWGDIQYQHLIYMNVLPADTDPRRKPTSYELSLVLDSLTASHALLVEDGAGAARKAADERKVILNLEQSEVERVLSELGGQVWKNVLC